MKRTGTTRRRSVGRAVIAALLAAALETGAPVAGAQTGGNPASPSAQLKQRLLDATEGRGRVERNPVNGRVRLFGTDPAHALPRSPGMPANASPEAAARGFLASFGTLFGADDQARQLQVRRTASADRGRANVRFQQVHGGVPVLAGELAVNLDRDRKVLSANGELSPGLNLDTRPAITATEARTTALEAIAKVAGLEPGQLVRHRACALGLRPGSDRRSAGDGRRRSCGARRSRRRPTTASHDGSWCWSTPSRAPSRCISTRSPTPRPGAICDRNNSTSGGETCTAPYTRSEGSGRRESPTWTTHTHSPATSTTTSPATSGVTASTAPACRSSLPCASARPSGRARTTNAFWNGAPDRVRPRASCSDDIVGHEFAHGVTEHESNLFYYYQSGAINESLSDVFGELIDLGNGLGQRHRPACGGISGEDLARGAIRDMRTRRHSGIPTPWTARSTATSSERQRRRAHQQRRQQQGRLPDDRWRHVQRHHRHRPRRHQGRATSTTRPPPTS